MSEYTDIGECDECGTTTRGDVCRRCSDREVSLADSIAEALR